MSLMSTERKTPESTGEITKRPRRKPVKRSVRYVLVQSLASLAVLVLVVGLSIPLLNWAIFDATFVANSAAACRQNVDGACWAFIGEKHRLILFGTYPFEQQWRPLLASILMIVVVACSGIRYFWNRKLIVLWGLGLFGAAVLMWGGVLGLTHVEDELWGGLPVTLMFATFGIAFGFPLGVLLALGRRSNMPIIRSLSVVYIEIVRGVPLISVLFMSSVMLPLFLPDGWSIDKLLRAQLAIILFAGAYIAEVVRGGLQSVPRGQYEGADSLGLSYGQKTFRIVLPQAIRVVVGPLTSTFISLFKDTSLVVIIGILDLTLSTRAALADTAWGGFDIEAYFFVATIYFAFCFSLSRFGKSVEKRLSRGHQ